MVEWDETDGPISPSTSNRPDDLRARLVALGARLQEAREEKLRTEDRLLDVKVALQVAEQDRDRLAQELEASQGREVELREAATRYINAEATYAQGGYVDPKAYREAMQAFKDMECALAHPSPAAQAIGRAPRTLCLECGPNVAIDEDGCCAICGATATGPWLEYVRVFSNQPQPPAEPAQQETGP